MLTQSMETIDPLRIYKCGRQCVSELLLSMHTLPVAASPEELDRFVVIATGNRHSCGQPSRNDANQVPAVFLANTCLNCACSPSDSSSMTVSSC